MKKIYLLAFTGLFTSLSYGQCAGGRYASDVFTTVDMSTAVYGSDDDYLGATT